MAKDQSAAAEVSDLSTLVTPRWVTPALFALFGVAAIAALLTGHVVTGVVIAIGTAIALMLAIIFRQQLRAFDRRRAAANPVSYGWLSLIGLGWVLLGGWWLATPASDVVPGGALVGIGLIMVLAYAPKFFQRRSLARNR